ncbi:Uncharacterized protein M6B38_231010 [Iris pallida]|uniref:Uncharacterized protein n=1 Tax=Iris pallida TaxID=29817 RepID=A0AAX6DR00_IRIPA|nr:Uncharacterized protein M6B38_231010 [Iris pallida]
MELASSSGWQRICGSCGIQVLPKLSSQTLHAALLTSDELWIPNEEKRFELALYTMLAKGTFSEVKHAERESSTTEIAVATSDSSVLKGKNLIDNCGKQLLESEFQQMAIEYSLERHTAVVEPADCILDFQRDVPYSKSVPIRTPTCSQPLLDSRYSTKMEQPENLNLPPDSNTGRTSCSFVELRNGTEVSRIGGSEAAMEGPSGDSTCYQINNNIWLPRDQDCSSSSGVVTSDWERCMPPLWGGRIVGKGEAVGAQSNCGMRREEYDAFKNIFEGGSLLYCNMSFEALLNARKTTGRIGLSLQSCK